MPARRGGFTMVEMLMVIGALVLLAVVVLVAFPARESRRRESCGNNLGNIIKCCHLYSDLVTNLGLFPVHRSHKDANGVEAMNLLYGMYVKDHRVFACLALSNAGRGARTAEIPEFTGNQSTTSRWMTPAHTDYGYDPGHSPVHSWAGILSDWSDDANKNSTHHGANRPGQNVALGAGCVEWWDTSTRQGDEAHGDRMFWPDGFLPELETFIVQ